MSKLKVGDEVIIIKCCSYQCDCGYDSVVCILNDISTNFPLPYYVHYFPPLPYHVPYKGWFHLVVKRTKLTESLYL